MNETIEEQELNEFATQIKIDELPEKYMKTFKMICNKINHKVVEKPVSKDDYYASTYEDWLNKNNITEEKRAKGLETTKKLAEISGCPISFKYVVKKIEPVGFSNIPRVTWANLKTGININDVEIVRRTRTGKETVGKYNKSGKGSFSLKAGNTTYPCLSAFRGAYADRNDLFPRYHGEEKKFEDLFNIF